MEFVEIHFSKIKWISTGGYLMTNCTINCDLRILKTICQSDALLDNAWKVWVFIDTCS